MCCKEHTLKFDMADKKKMKQRKGVEENPTKEEYAVAKYLRFNLPPREGKLHGMEVQCFFGNAAVDMLLESKWSAAKNAKEPLFTTRVSCVAYMLSLLEKGIFHRAERDKKKKDKDEKDREKTKKKKKKEKDEKEAITAPEEEVRERKKGDKSDKKEAEAATEDTEQKGDGDKKVEKKEEKKKKEKRLRLVMPDQQFFEDSEEVYVWIYDPVNAKNFMIGLLMVLGAIALCMFPLWPPEVRIGVYYISLSAAGFVGFILSLVVVRLILFCVIWVLTVGHHHFWFLPNLTEDVGFFDSFRPLYKHDYMPGSTGGKAKAGSDSKEKKKKKEKKPEKEEVPAPAEQNSDKEDSDDFELIKKEELSEGGPDGETDGKEEEEETGDKEDDLNDAGNDDEEEDDDEDEEDNRESDEQDNTDTDRKKTN